MENKKTKMLLMAVVLSLSSFIGYSQSDYDTVGMAKSVDSIYSLLVNSADIHEFLTKNDTIKVQLLISTIDSSNTAFMQIGVYARNGYVVLRFGNVIKYLDYFKQPLSSDEIVWDFRKLKK